jgi:hypothetical protein
VERKVRKVELLTAEEFKHLLEASPPERSELPLQGTKELEPLPADEQNPLTNVTAPAGGGNTQEYLILWLAYKEAKATMKFDAAPAANWLMRALADHRLGQTAGVPVWSRHGW